LLQYDDDEFSSAVFSSFPRELHRLRSGFPWNQASDLSIRPFRRR
jgi:hypothetical protein